MDERNARQGYSAYLKYAYASAFTISSFLLAKSSGFLPTSWLSDENNNDNYVHEKRALSNLTQSSLIEANELSRFPTAGRPEHISIQGNYAFIAEGNAGLEIVDISNASNPIKAGSYNTNSFVYQVKPSANYAYVAADTAGLRILNIQNMNNISLVANYTMKTIVANSPTIARVTHLALFNDYVYVIGGDSARMDIIDTTKPILPSSYPMFSYTDAITDVVQYDNYLFLANSLLGLNIIDENSFLPPYLINLPVNNPTSISVLGVTAYIIDASGLKIIDISNPKAPQLLGTYLSSAYLGTVSVSGDIAYVTKVANSTTNGGLLIINVSNPASPILLSQYAPPTISGGDVSISDSIAYVTNNKGLTTIDVSDPFKPFLLGVYSAQGSIYCGKISGNMGFLTGYFQTVEGNVFGIQIIDVTYPKTPLLLDTISGDTSKIGIGIGISEAMLYVTTDSILKIIDVCNPTPVFVGSYTPDNAAKLGFKSNYNSLTSTYNAVTSINSTTNLLYVLSATNSTYVFSTQSSKSRFSMSQSAVRVAANNNYAYVADIKKLLHVIDVSNSLIPVEVGSYNLLNAAQSMMLSGDFLYIAEGRQGIEIVDVSDPLNPVLSGKITAGITDAQTLNIINNQFLYVGDAVAGLIVFDIPEKLVIVNNQLIISQGQTVNITLADISARDTRQVGFYPQLAFTVSNVTHGLFVFSNNSNQPITQFTQQDIISGAIQFSHDGGQVPPSYLLAANNGALVTFPIAPLVTFPVTVNITFYKIIQAPVLVANKLIINEGQTLTLSQNDINATSYGAYDPQLQFTVNNIGNGRFQLKTEPGIFRTQFSQKQIFNGLIQFVHLGEGKDKPSYQILVSNADLSTSYADGNIDFDAAPQLINNTLNINNGETIIIDYSTLQAIDIDSTNATLIFDISNIAHGKFISSKNNANNSAINQFIQQDIADGFISFVHDGLNAAPAYTVSVSDGRANSANQTATVLFDSTKNSSNLPAIIGGVIAGVGGAGLLLAGLGLFAKRQYNQTTRNKHRLAAYIWEELKLQGIDNFGTDLGKKYVAMIEDNLIPELKQHGYDTDTMQDYDLRELSKNIATIAKNKISHSTTFFGSTLITVDDLSQNIDTIVQGVLNGDYMTLRKDSTLENDGEIGLKSFMPSFNLNAKEFENV